MSFIQLLLICLLVLVWGVNFVVIKLGLDGFPPLFLVFTRFFLTSIPAVFFFKRPKAPFSKVVLYGLVIFALQFSLFFIGMQLGMPPGLAALVIQIHIFFSLILAVIFFREKINFWQILGAIVSFLGIAYAGWHVSGQASLVGFILVIIAAAFWGCGSAISKSIGKVNMVGLVVWGSLVAWPVLLAFSLLLEGPALILQSLENISWVTAGSVCYLTYLSTLFGYGLWSWLLHHLPLSRVAPFTLFVPVVAMAASAWMFNEPLQTWKIYSSVLIIGGLVLNFLSSRFKKKKNDASLIT
ncbi:MAG TPA: EamA family transporter [Chlamydiales bacterium]|nr:EamA family transporter [Chlamydiales bacterium]